MAVLLDKKFSKQSFLGDERVSPTIAIKSELREVKQLDVGIAHISGIKSGWGFPL